MKRLVLIALLITAPAIIAARLTETASTPPLAPAAPAGKTETAAAWRPITGPAEPRPAPADSPAPPLGLTVHEWGTFTSVAGPDGKAMAWLPAGGPTDLPCFVKVDGAGPKGLAFTEQGGRAAYGKVRMETPVLYFYSAEDQTVDVKVSFPHGLITEWFPNVNDKQPFMYDAKKGFPDVATIQWRGVQVRPGATVNYPIEEGKSHYYAARRTGSAPLQVGTGDPFAKEFEKFLFYRGIADFTPPISAQSAADGAITVASLARNALPGVILFENREGRIGYRIAKNVSNAVRLTRPELNASFDSLQTDLEDLLKAQGMYPMEARAMVDTWSDSWFEQGVRVFYILPDTSIASILPLDVDPKPVSVARAFVGRVEVFPADLRETIRRAIVHNDKPVLATYGRFIEPVVNTFLAGRLTPAETEFAQSTIKSLRADYLESAKACSGKRAW